MNKLDIVIDANQMISALLGGKALQVLYSGYFRFFTTERKTWEVKRYIPMIAAKSGASEEKVYRTFELFPIIAYQDAFFDAFKNEADALIGSRDPTDADLLGLALKLKHPLWSHDRDFSKIRGIDVVKIEDLLAFIEKRKLEKHP